MQYFRPIDLEKLFGSVLNTFWY
uniref:Uncharacterized protein n=1 Tax=Anguilla anguilla TaxID=7936 RepID=A0A0E9PW38_ANGAN